MIKNFIFRRNYLYIEIIIIIFIFLISPAVSNSADEVSPKEEKPSMKEEKAKEGYTLNLKELINRTKKKIEKVDEKLEDQAMDQRNLERENKAREYYEKGMRAQEEGKYDKAKEWWEKAVKITEHPEMKNYVQKSVKRQNEKEKALTREEEQQLKRLEQERGYSVKEVQKKYDSAVKKYKNGDYIAAKAEFEEVDKMFPDHKATKSYLSLINYMIDYDQKYLIAKKLHDNTAESSKAKEQWKKEIDRKENERQERLQEQAEAVYQEALKLYKDKEYDQAKKKFREVEWILPEYKKTLDYLSKIDKDVEKESKVQFSEEEELKYFKKQVKKEKLSGADKAIEGSQRSDDEVLKEQEKRRKEEAQFVYDSAVTLYKKKYYEQSLDKFNQVVQIYPQYKNSDDYIKKLHKKIPGSEEKTNQAAQKPPVFSQENVESPVDLSLNDLPENQQILLREASDKYQEALAFYQEGNFIEAQRKFVSVEAIYPGYKDTREHLKYIDDQIAGNKPLKAGPIKKNPSIAYKDTSVKSQPVVLDLSKDKIVMVEQSYREAKKIYDSGNYELAKEKFTSVDQMQPGYKATEDYLKKIEKKLLKELAQREKYQRIEGSKEIISADSEQKDIQKTAALEQKENYILDKEMPKKEQKKKSFIPSIFKPKEEVKEYIPSPIEAPKEEKKRYEPMSSEEYIIMQNKIQQKEDEARAQAKAERLAREQEQNNIEADNKKKQKLLEEQIAKENLARKVALKKAEKAKKIEKTEKVEKLENKPNEDIVKAEDSKNKIAAEKKNNPKNDNSVEIKKKNEEVKAVYEEARKLYDGGQYLLAKEKFQAVENLSPNYKKTKEYAQSVEKYLELQDKQKAETVKSDTVQNNVQGSAQKNVKEEAKQVKEVKVKQPKKKLEIPPMKEENKLTRSDKREIKYQQAKIREYNSIQKQENKNEIAGVMDDIYEEAVDLFNRKQYRLARAKFISLYQMKPGYRLSKIYIKRIDWKRISAAKKQARVAKFVEEIKKDAEYQKERMAKTQEEQKLTKMAEEIYVKSVGLYKAKDYQKAKDGFNDLQQLKPGYRRTLAYLKKIDEELSVNQKRENIKDKLLNKSDKKLLVEEAKPVEFDQAMNKEAQEIVKKDDIIKKESRVEVKVDQVAEKDQTVVTEKEKPAQKNKKYHPMTDAEYKEALKKSQMQEEKERQEAKEQRLYRADNEQLAAQLEDERLEKEQEEKLRIKENQELKEKEVKAKEVQQNNVVEIKDLSKAEVKDQDTVTEETIKTKKENKKLSAAKSKEEQLHMKEARLNKESMDESAKEAEQELRHNDKLIKKELTKKKLLELKQKDKEDETLAKLKKKLMEEDELKSKKTVDDSSEDGLLSEEARSYQGSIDNLKNEAGKVFKNNDKLIKKELNKKKLLELEEKENEEKSLVKIKEKQEKEKELALEKEQKLVRKDIKDLHDQIVDMYRQDQADSARDSMSRFEMLLAKSDMNDDQKVETRNKLNKDIYKAQEKLRKKWREEKESDYKIELPKKLENQESVETKIEDTKPMAAVTPKASKELVEMQKNIEQQEKQLQMERELEEKRQAKINKEQKVKKTKVNPEAVSENFVTEIAEKKFTREDLEKASRNKKEELEKLVRIRQAELKKQREKIQKDFEASLDELYNKAVRLYKKGVGDQAAHIFTEIDRMKPGYKDTEKYLSKIGYQDGYIEEPIQEPRRLVKPQPKKSKNRIKEITNALDSFEQKVLW